MWKNTFHALKKPAYSKCNLCNATVPAESTKKVRRQRKPGQAAKHQTFSKKVDLYLSSKPNLNALKVCIPDKYLKLSRVTPDNLYLVDSDIAKDAIDKAYPIIIKNESQIVAETNAGFGLLATELLQRGIKLVRLYEACPDFRTTLKDFNEIYPGRVELFTKNIYNSNMLNFLDKMDNGDRIQQLLSGVPFKKWHDDPAMTVMGPMPSMSFMKFLIKSLALQMDFVKVGRIQMIPFMTPALYTILTADNKKNLHTYQWHSVLFSTFFEYKFLEKYPRKSFLPWSHSRGTKKQRYPYKIDPDYLYLTQINFKKELPLSQEELRVFYFFVKQLFGRGTRKVIPHLETWINGFGENLFLPRLDHGKGLPKNINIFTQAGELTPTNILCIFKEFVNHPKFNESSLHGLIEAELLQTETTESDDVEKEEIRDNVPK